MKINLSTYVHLAKAWTVDPFEIFLGALVSCWLERPCNLYIKLYVEIKLPKEMREQEKYPMRGAIQAILKNL